MYFIKFALGVLSGIGVAIVSFIIAFRYEIWNWSTWKLCIIAFILMILKYMIHRRGYSKGDDK